MASNSFGNIFRITTWGESHGTAIGVVIDGCPAGLPLVEADIQLALDQRAPGKNAFTSPRKEKDQAEILSGVFSGETTGAPISIMIKNHDHDSSRYEPIKNLMRPGHANFTYLEKYGVFDYRGGGRASARETACRVAAGAVAGKLLAYFGIKTLSYVQTLGDQFVDIKTEDLDAVRCRVLADPLFCPDSLVSKKMQQQLEAIKAEGDSLGAIVAFCVDGLPIGLGDPMYEKLEANLAKAMLSIHASKGFEVGDGFAAAGKKGSEHNDSFTSEVGKIKINNNHSGGTLGGISSGARLLGRVAFKPTSSIKKAQSTVDVAGNEAIFELPPGSRHDPCVAIRAVPVVEAMLALVLADALLMNRCSQIARD